MSEAVATPSAPAAPAPAATPAPAAPAADAPQAVQNTEEQAPSTAPEGEQPDTTEESPEKRAGKSRYERRLDKAYRRLGAAEERALRAEREAQELRAKLTPAATPSDSGSPAEPKIESFNSIEDFRKAYAEYAQNLAKAEREKAVKEIETKRQNETQQQQKKRLDEAWNQKATRGEDKYEDWEQVVGEIQPTTPWALAIMEAENGDEVAYFLGKNEKEAIRINSLPPVAQILEIGRLAAKLAAEPPKPKTPSKAPAPITPLTGAAPVVTDVPSDKDDMRTWMAKRQKQVHGKRA